MVVKSRKQVPRTCILRNNHTPSKEYWDLSVDRAMQRISRRDSVLMKVVTSGIYRYQYED